MFNAPVQFWNLLFMHMNFFKSLGEHQFSRVSIKATTSLSSLPQRFNVIEKYLCKKHADIEYHNLSWSNSNIHLYSIILTTRLLYQMEKLEKRSSANTKQLNYIDSNDYGDHTRKYSFPKKYCFLGTHEFAQISFITDFAKSFMHGQII